MMRLSVPFLFGCAALIAAMNFQPRYEAGGQMMIPEGYRQWQFVGSNMGIGYDASIKKGTFKNIYIQPEAYQAFKSTGKFPDKTVLVMEVFSAGEKASPAKTGQFEEKFLGIEAAVKDEAKFPNEKWAYYNFIGQSGGALKSAKAFPKEACWNCHNEHAKVDNVFVQFYPALRD